LDALDGCETPLMRMPDRSSWSGAEMLETIGLLAGVFDDRGLRAGDDLVLSDLQGPFELLLLMAGLSRGLNVVLSQDPWQGARPALLVHSDDQTSPEDFKAIALPLGESGAPEVSLLKLAAEVR